MAPNRAFRLPVCDEGEFVSHVEIHLYIARLDFAFLPIETGKKNPILVAQSTLMKI